MGHSIESSSPRALVGVHFDARLSHGRAERAPRGGRGARDKQRGGCDCGAVRFELQLEPWFDEVSLRESQLRVRDFRLLTGEEHVSGHQFAARDVHHFYCERCGVCSFTRHNTDHQDAAFYAVSVACLDW